MPLIGAMKMKCFVFLVIPITKLCNIMVVSRYRMSPDSSFFHKKIPPFVILLNTLSILVQIYMLTDYVQPRH